MKNCIILTCEYPYITGEPFLENEIQYLRESFDNIYIFSLNASIGNRITRQLPDNAKSFPLNCVLSKVRYPIYIIRSLLTVDKELKCFHKGFGKTITSLYEKGRSGKVFRDVISIIEKENIDISDCVVYSYWFTDQAIVAYRIKEYIQKRGGTAKAVARGHGYDIYWERNSLGYLPFQELLLSKLDGLYTCSQNGKDYLLEKYPAYSDNIHVARLGTNDYGFKKECTTKTIVTCCSLYPFKQILLFARAFKRIHDKICDCNWVCIGDGTDFDALKKYVDENNLRDCVTLMGRLPNYEVIEFYRQSNIYLFCNVSRFEGAPVCVMEAMSFGIPVVATAAGGTGELVNNRNGVLHSVDVSEDELVNSIIDILLMDKEQYCDIRKNARETWEQLSSAEKCFSAWCQILLS